MDSIQLLIFILATWRISSLLVNEDGPWFIFERLRTWSGIYWHTPMPYHIQSDRSPSLYLDAVKIVPDRFWPQLLSCVWCCSIWVGIGWVILFRLFPWNALFLAAPFAFSAGAILFNLVVEKLEK